MATAIRSPAAARTGKQSTSSPFTTPVIVRAVAVETGGSVAVGALFGSVSAACGRLPTRNVRSSDRPRLVRSRSRCAPSGQSAGMRIVALAFVASTPVSETTVIPPSSNQSCSGSANSLPVSVISRSTPRGPPPGSMRSIVSSARAGRAATNATANATVISRTARWAGRLVESSPDRMQERRRNIASPRLSAAGGRRVISLVRPADPHGPCRRRRSRRDGCPGPSVPCPRRFPGSDTPLLPGPRR